MTETFVTSSKHVKGINNRHLYNYNDDIKIKELYGSFSQELSNPNF